MRVVVAGLVGQYALGGVAWDYLQYVLGFRDLGHDVWYVEDTLTWPYDPVGDTVTADASRNVRFLADASEVMGAPSRWAYRNGADQVLHGMSEEQLNDVLQDADLFVNVSGATLYGREQFPHAKLIHIDGDPMFHQIGLVQRKDSDYAAMFRAYDVCCTFGLHVNQPDCLIPTGGITWHPTVQPIHLESWKSGRPLSENAPWTTVMNWSSYKPSVWQGQEYGHKDREFLKMLELPTRGERRFVIAMARGCDTHPEWGRLTSAGWRIVDPLSTLSDGQAYRQFIVSSRGEWSIAKHGYVAGRTGWFSGRTGCYLAAGRPSVVQDTGWSSHLPVGNGLLGFTTLEEAVAALDEVEADYERHSKAARDLAVEYFNASKVCASLIDLANAS